MTVVCGECALKHHRRCLGETEACACVCPAGMAWTAWWDAAADVRLQVEGPR